MYVPYGGGGSPVGVSIVRKDKRFPVGWGRAWHEIVWDTPPSYGERRESLYIIQTQSGNAFIFQELVSTY